MRTRWTTGRPHLSHAALIPAIALLLLISGCQEENPVVSDPDSHDPVITMIGSSGCKNFEDVAMPETGAIVEPPSPDMDCIDYSFEDGVLHLTHINAGFNCCPGEISADITVEGDMITITEHEDMKGCHCLCLFDVEYEIENLEAGEYTIRFIELYTEEGDDPLEFPVDLASVPQGDFCVERHHYPWDIVFTGPVGRVADYAICRGAYDGFVTLDFPPDVDCASYWYYDTGILVIEHVNAAFNCCTEEPLAVIRIVNNTITITESEEGEFCDCICIAEVTYEIRNLPVGEYTISIDGLYVSPEDQTLEFTADLEENPVCSYCVERSHYPWMPGGSQEEDFEKLARMREAIEEYIGVPTCLGDDDCRTIAFGDKPCGGPWVYLIYSAATVDEELLAAMVCAYNTYNNVLNCRHGISSDCALAPKPEVGCVRGRCAEIND